MWPFWDSMKLHRNQEVKHSLYLPRKVYWAALLKEDTTLGDHEYKQTELILRYVHFAMVPNVSLPNRNQCGLIESSLNLSSDFWVEISALSLSV